MKNLFVAETVKKIGEEVELYGWVDTKRDHKKIVFIDLRDRSGIVQVVAGEECKTLTSEGVVRVKGVVKKRPENLVNPKIPTGTIEVEAKEVVVLNKAKGLPFPVSGDGYNIDEEVRQKYRYLDLRRPRLSRNIALKSRFIQLA